MIATIKNYAELSKVRMIPMVLITAVFGFVLASKGSLDWTQLLLSLIGMSFVSAGSATLNNYIERDTDKLMNRTKNRVLPSGVISASSALTYGIVSVLLGVFILAIQVNILTGFLLLLASFLYVLVYTPMKRQTWLNTFVGAFPGAVPPLAGWTAATGQIEWGGVVLFLILFTWQHPHFYAIALMHREDYKRGGFEMLPLIKDGLKKTFRQTLVYTVLMILVSVLPTVIGLSGWIYFAGAFMMGLYFFSHAVDLCLQPIDSFSPNQLFKASLVYLPALLFFIVLDGVIL